MIWGNWLRSAQPLIAYSKFQHFEYIEETLARECVAPTLAEIIYSYHSQGNSSEQAILRELRFSQTANVLRSDQRPQAALTRRGNFAEILACEFAKELLGYEIPVNRLHLNPNVEQSMKGDDILGFKFADNSNSRCSVLIGEAKYRGSFDSRAVKEAYAALKRGYRPYPASMDFSATVLRHEGSSQKAEQVDQIKRLLSSNASTVKRERLIMLVTMGSRPRDPFGYIERLAHVVDDLVAVNICLGARANTWINFVYETDVK